MNLSIQQKTVPECTKWAKVTPLHKKNSKLDIGNYRPVSVLTSLSKILERAVLVQVEKHCMEKGLLYELQSGFRSTFSTDTCLIYLHDYIRTNISKGNFVGMLLLDVQKAFDSVDHVMLCEKLRLAGIDEMWFRSYLSDRKQIVYVNNCQSSAHTITSGVPQGSILGPWAYLMYCNDMTTSISCKLLLYADDAILLYSHNDISKVTKELGKEVSNCYQWLTNNKLSMHMGKTEGMILCSKRKKRQLKDVTIKCQEHSIKPSEEVKYLGLKINNTLSGEATVSDIVKKTTSRLKFLYRNAKFLDFHARKLLVSTLIQCHFDYAISAWFMGLSKCLRKKLQISQNKLVRFVLDLGPRAHVGQCELDRIGYLNTEDRAKQLMLNHMFNVYRQVAPNYLCKNFRLISHQYSTRYAQCNFAVPRPRGIDKYNFSYQGVLAWNDLPISIKSVNSKSMFKSKVKKFLKTQAHYIESRNYVTY